MINQAQQYLIENKLDDLILNDRDTTKPEERIYASDAMMRFCECRHLTTKSSGQKKHQHIPYHTGSGEIVCSECGEICGCR